MKVITDESCMGYHRTAHPERPERISMTVAKLKEQSDFPITWVKPSLASEEAILRAHTPEMVARLSEPYDFDGDTAYFPNIEELAKRAAGAAIDAMKLARQGETVFSLMRPPGHHATRNQTMGFCYLSSLAIAVLEALATGAKRVAVYDFDVHHGNGTEDVLLNKPGAAFFSIHQFPCYPGTGARHVGDNCFNYPVPPQLPRSEYRKVLTRALDELKGFKPDLIAVSAGFDAYARDPLAEETLEAEDYHWLGECFRKAGVPVFSALEGGYSNHLPELIFAYLKGLNGE